MSSKVQMNPEFFQIFTWKLVSVHNTRRKFLKAVRGSYLPFVIKHALFPSRNHELPSELLRFVRGVCPNFRQTGQFFTTSSWWNDITSSKVSCFSDHLLIFWNKNAMALHACTCVHAVRPIWFNIPSNLLHMELSRTQLPKYHFSNRYG